jgi:hypothetical protein
MYCFAVLQSSNFILFCTACLFTCLKSKISNINVKRRLKNSVHFWEKFGTSDFILDIIYEGYKIPLLHEPKLVFLNNNKSAYAHTIITFIDNI